MIFTGIFYDKANRLVAIPWLTLGAIIIFILSELGVSPKTLGVIRVDLILLGVLAMVALISIMADRRK